ncbi:MAG: hypothetical protein QNJ44_21900 [Rhodobacter sp.]|nr:hypothetical protein [Rhodobacter sp.]
MPDPFGNRARTPSDPAVSVFAIVPDDAADLAQPTTAINVITPGKLRITTVDGTEGTISVHPGHAFPVRAARVWNTGTTATGITGLV